MPITQFELVTKIVNVGNLITNGNPKDKFGGGQCYLGFLFVRKLPSTFHTDKCHFN